MVARLDVRAAHEVDPPRVDDDELRALAQALLHPRREDRVAVGRVGTDDHDDVGVLDRREVLRPGGRPERRLEAVAGRRVADPGAGVDVVRAEGRSHHLLDEVDLLVRAARRGDAADGGRAVLRGDRLEAARRVGDGLVPADLTPRLVDRVADHRVQDAILVIGVPPREAALDARVPLVRASALVRDHVHDRVALHLGLERAPDTAVRAGRQDASVRWSELDEGLLLEGVGRAGLHAGAAAHALGLEERLVLAGRDARIEAATGDRQGERALDLVARPNAARTDDALGRIEGEVRVADVLGRVLVAGRGLAVAGLGHPDDRGHVVQLARPVARAGQAVLRVVAEVQLHDAGAKAIELLALGLDRHPVAARRRARRRRAASPVDLDQAQAARAECAERIRGAELGDVDAGRGRGAHDRGALGDGDLAPIHLDADRRGSRLGRCPEVLLPDERHAWPPVAGAARWPLEVLAEVSHSAPNGHRREAAHRAQRAVGHDLAEVLEEGQVRVAVLTADDPIDDLDATHGAHATGRALAARLLGAELHREPRLLRHVDGVVEHDEAAVADHRPGFDEGLVVHRQIELGRGEIRPEGTADLDRADRSAGAGPATEVLDERPEGQTERHLDDAAVGDVAAQLEDLGPARPAETERLVRLGAVGDDVRHGGQRQDVVHDRRLAEQSFDRGERRLRADLPALALEALEHRGLFATDVGARAHPDLQVEAQVRAKDAGAEPAIALGRQDRGAHRLDGGRVLGADVDEALARADGVRGDDHALDEEERIALHEHPVRVRPRVALVRVAADELQVTGRVEDGLPLDAGREPGATSSAQPGGRDLGHEVGRGHRERSFEGDEPAIRPMIRHRQRVDDPDAGEHPALLPGEPWDLIGGAVAEGVVAAGQEAGIEQ